MPCSARNMFMWTSCPPLDGVGVTAPLRWSCTAATLARGTLLTERPSVTSRIHPTPTVDLVRRALGNVEERRPHLCAVLTAGDETEQRGLA